MNSLCRSLALSTLLLPVSPAMAEKASTGRADSAEAVIADWPQKPQEAARQMISQYGQPDGVAAFRLTWQDAGPWKEIVVDKEEVPHSFPMDHTDIVEQVVAYKVPPDKFDELARYDGSVIAERTKGTLSARCDKEAMNFLALNLADDIVKGKRTVEDARDFYAKTAAAFKQGQKDPYTQRLQFDTRQARTGDPDQPAKPGADKKPARTEGEESKSPEPSAPETRR